MSSSGEHIAPGDDPEMSPLCGDARQSGDYMTVPLAAYPAGELEVDMRIVDKRMERSVVQKARFSVME